MSHQVSQWGRQLNHPSKVVFVLKRKINKWVPSPTTEPASSTTLWKFVFVLKWKINKWVTSPTTEPASWTTRWKVVFVLKWKMNKWVISPRWGPAISTTLRKVVFVQQEKIIKGFNCPTKEIRTSQPPFKRSSLFDTKMNKWVTWSHNLKSCLCLKRKIIKGFNSLTRGPAIATTFWKVVSVSDKKIYNSIS